MTDDTSADTSDGPFEKKPRRQRSTGFPVVPLPEAASVLREAGKFGFEHSLSAFARAMGHETTNSGAFRQRLSAFRDWKLVAGRGDLISFTDVGRTLAVASSDDVRQTALRTAFMSFELFARIYDALAKGETLDADLLGETAVLNYGVSPKSRSKFVESFGLSVEAAGLGETTEGGSVLLFKPDRDADLDSTGNSGYDSWENPLVGNTARTETTRRSLSTPEIAVPIVVSQSWDLGDGVVHFEIRRRAPLSGPTFTAVGQVVEALDALAKTLDSRPDYEHEDGGRADP